MKAGHWRNISFLSQVLNWIDEYTHNHTGKVRSIIRKADEIYTRHLRTYMPYQQQHLTLLLLVVRFLPPVLQD
jgi:hypothetical protein